MSILLNPHLNPNPSPEIYTLYWKLHSTFVTYAQRNVYSLHQICFCVFFIFYVRACTEQADGRTDERTDKAAIAAYRTAEQ